MSSGRFASLTRWFLYLLIASIAIGAVLAIWLVLRGNWGWTEARILLTTGVIAAASLIGMACGAAISRGTAWWVPGAGIGLAVIGAALLIAGMWLEVDDPTFWRYTSAACILAVSGAHISLLSTARLAPTRAWVQLVAYGLIFVFAMILIGIIFSDGSSDAVVRALAVVGILDAAFTLLVPVLHFLDRRTLEALPPSPGSAATQLAALEEEIAAVRTRLAELEQRREALRAP